MPTFKKTTIGIIHSQQPANQYAGGKTGITNSEQHWMRELAKQVVAELKTTGHTVLQGPTGDAKSTYQTNVTWANKQPLDALISLHSNATGKAGTKATGIQVYYCTDNGKKIADALVKRLKPASAANKASAINKRISSEITQTKAPAVLVENEYHDWEGSTTTGGAKWLRDASNRAKLAKAYRAAIVDLYGENTASTAIPAPVSQMFRVRKTWNDSGSQLGAFKILDNAIARAKTQPGYSVFDAAGKAVWTPTPAPTPAPVPSGKIRIRILSGNMETAGLTTKRVEAIVKLVNQHNPDVICLQDCNQTIRDAIRKNTDRKVWVYGREAVMWNSKSFDYKNPRTASFSSMHGAICVPLIPKGRKTGVDFISTHVRSASALQVLNKITEPAKVAAAKAADALKAVKLAGSWPCVAAGDWNTAAHKDTLTKAGFARLTPQVDTFDAPGDQCIDAVWEQGAIKLVSQKLILTGTASDHSWWLVEIEI